jgi:hypothetical protein
MFNWQSASEQELKQFQVISSFLSHRVNLIQYLFHSDIPKLNSSPEKIISKAKGLCTSDKVLLRVALQLWCEHGQISIPELFCLDADVFLRVLKAIESLGPKPCNSLQKLMAVE